MHECSEAGAGVGRRRLDRAPAQIIAEIAAGIARGPRVNAGAIGRAQQFCNVRAKHHGVGAAGDRALVQARMVGIGPQRGDGIAGAGLDPHIGRTGSKTEHQQRMRPPRRQQIGQFTIDGGVRYRKDVARQFDVAERGAAQPHQPSHQRLRRVKGRSGKRAEAGDEDTEFLAHLISASRRSALPPAPA